MQQRGWTRWQSSLLLPQSHVPDDRPTKQDLTAADGFQELEKMLGAARDGNLEIENMGTQYSPSGRCSHALLRWDVHLQRLQNKPPYAQNE